MERDIYLGSIPPRIKAWIIKHASEDKPDPVDSSDWGQLVAKLENCSAIDFSEMDYVGSDELLTSLKVGSGTSINYKIDDAGSAVPTTWINLGFNSSIPKYVKYRRAVRGGWKHVWVKSIKSELINKLIAPIAVGDSIYIREYDDQTLSYVWTEVEGETITAIDGSFTYGNNCTYSVPMTITTSKNTYEFCGYNMTLNSQALLMLDSSSTYEICFNRQNNVSSNSRSIYDISRIRHWMNDLTCTDAACHNNEFKLLTAATLINKMNSETGLIRNISTIVNRTWVHFNNTAKATQALDSNQCEHLDDKFWLLGYGHVNVSSSSVYDYTCDTSRFLQFAENSDRIKYLMLSDGSTGSSASNWWLRSANSFRFDFISFVGSTGSTSNYGGAYYSCCSPVFVLG